MSIQPDDILSKVFYRFPQCQEVMQGICLKLLEIENPLASVSATYPSNIPSEDLEKRILYGPVGLFGVYVYPNMS